MHIEVQIFGHSAHSHAIGLAHQQATQPRGSTVSPETPHPERASFPRPKRKTLREVPPPSSAVCKQQLCSGQIDADKSIIHRTRRAKESRLFGHNATTWYLARNQSNPVSRLPIPVLRVWIAQHPFSRPCLFTLPNFTPHPGPGHLHCCSINQPPPSLRRLAVPDPASTLITLLPHHSALLFSPASLCAGGTCYLV